CAVRTSVDARPRRARSWEMKKGQMVTPGTLTLAQVAATWLSSWHDARTVGQVTNHFFQPQRPTIRAPGRFVDSAGVRRVKTSLTAVEGGEQPDLGEGADREIESGLANLRLQ